MAEIRQIQVDGVNYDLVVSEDEVSATAAAQSAAQALAYKNQAQTSAAQAQTQATNASNQADRAEDAASRAEQIVGGEFLSYGGDQPLDEEEKEQARKNAVVGKSNYNLLDNSWFTVRQRGNGPFGAGAGYTVDRWTKFYNGIITGTDNGVSIAPNTTSGWIELAQYLPADVGAALEGKTLTLSALLQDGTLYSNSGVCIAKPSSGTTNFITISMPNSMGFVIGRRDDGGLRVEFTYGQALSQDPLNVRAVKLELGTYSTLVNDTKPDYATELARCIYSTADPTDTYANNGFGRSNKNLLDNPWWGSGEVVNQRAVTAKPSTNGSYTIDRWKLSSGADANQWAIGTNGITFTIASSSIWYMQIIPNISSLFGKTLTASVMFGDGTIKSGTATLTSSASATFWGDTQSNVSLNTAGTFQFTVRTTQTIRAVKLEIGSVSTLANDVPPDYNSELRKCRYYFRRISNPAGGAQWCLTGINATATVAIFILESPMRNVTKTISYSGSLQVNGVAVTSIGSYTRGHDTTLSVVTGGGLTQYGGAGLIIGANGYLDVSAEP